jgi:hypothetical protein
MIYVLFNELNKKVTITRNEEKMFDLLIGDNVLVGGVNSEKEIDKVLAEFYMSELDSERLYNNARTLTKLMIIHNMEMIDREVDFDFEDYFDEYIDMAFINEGDTVIHLFDGERYILHGLADSLLESHYMKGS